MGQHHSTQRDSSDHSKWLNANDSAGGATEPNKSGSDPPLPSSSNSKKMHSKRGSGASSSGRGAKDASSGTEILLPSLHQDAFLRVLTFVPGMDLVRNCRLVNSHWKEAIDGPHIWVNKLQRERNEKLPVEVDLLQHGVDIKKLYIRGTFRKNLIKNWEGYDMSTFWEVLSSNGNGFQMEPAVKPHGSKSLPVEIGCINCWATSYGDCIMRQFVDLDEYGCDQVWFDKLQPPIEVSEWIANRFDCAAVYQLSVFLCDKNKKPLNGEKFRHKYERRTPQWADDGWEKHTFTFTNYGPGVRYVLFQHKGVDGQFWAGHFGPKMAAPCVRLLPRASTEQLD